MKLDSMDPTSTTLLDRVGASPRDQAAWARFVGLYGPKIRGWCRRWGLQAADAEDATQDVLLRLAQKLGTFRYDPKRSFRGWLHTVTHNVLAGFIADRKPPNVPAAATKRYSSSSKASRRATTWSSTSRTRSTPRSWRWPAPRPRAQVEDQTWEAFRLTAYEGISGDDVAARLGMNRATVFKAKSRVLAFLREEIKLLDEP